MKADYPLLTTSPVQAPAPTTLRITDGHQGRAETLRARGHAFQLTTEEARLVSDVVTGMYLFIILSSYLLYAYAYIFDKYLPSEFLVCSCTF